MSSENKRPKGVTVALVLLSLDAGVMVIFLVVLIGMPEYVSLFEIPAFGQEYAILNSTELMFSVSSTALSWV